MIMTLWLSPHVVASRITEVVPLTLQPFQPQVCNSSPYFYSHDRWQHEQSINSFLGLEIRLVLLFRNRQPD